MSPGLSFEQPEDADYPATAAQWHRADLHRDSLPGGRDQDAGGIRGRGGAQHLLSEQLAGAAVVLRRDDGGELATTNVAEEPLGCGVDPLDDSRRVDDVARDTDVVQSLLEVAVNSQAGGHRGSVPDPGGAKRRR